MIFRAIAFLAAAFLLTAFEGRAATYQRSQDFGKKPSNWKQSTDEISYGYRKTTLFEGVGAAGGTLNPTSFFNYYGDTFLSGTFSRTQPFAASGQIVLRGVSGNPTYGATTYIAHFAKSANPFIQVAGMAISGTESGNLVLCAIVQFADGQAMVGKPVGVPVGSERVLNWSYDWDPAGGAKGAGRLQAKIGGRTAVAVLDETTLSSNFALDSFGIFQPPFNLPSSRSFLDMLISNVDYSANVGTAPRLRIQGPSRQATNESSVTLKGTAKVDKGNRIIRVRYRVINGSKKSRFRTADGTDRWKFQASVSRGNSRIQVLARSDDGTSTTKQRTIRRR